MGCTGSSLKGSSPDTTALNTPASALHQSRSKTSDHKTFTTSYSAPFDSEPASSPSTHDRNLSTGSSPPETQPQSKPKSKSKFHRTSKPSQTSDEEMLRYTGMTNAEMKAWAARQGPNERRSYAREVTSPAGFDPLVAGAAMGGM